MEAEVEEELRIQLPSVELETVSVAYSEMSIEDDCFREDISEMLLRATSKTTKDSTVVNLECEAEVMLQIMRRFVKQAEYKQRIGQEELAEEHWRIFNKLESQLVYQGLMVR